VKRARWALGLGLLLALAPAAACKREEKTPVSAVVALLPPLDARQEPLRARFDQEAAGPRLLLLSSPT